MTDEETTKAKLTEALEKGNVEFPEGKQEVLARMDARKPDFTVTEATVTTFDKGWFVIQWGTVSAGFGETTFMMRDGKLFCDTECMSRNFVKAVLAKLVDDTPMDIDDK
jgi:hypothetical protein